MDQGQEEEQYDSIYENDDSSERFNIAELLKEKSLDQLLTEDREHIKEAEQEFQWYHGKITRDTAEDALRRGISKYGSIDGLFLVRESSFSSSSFVLSLVSRGNFFHFQINEVKKTHFSIDDGPVIQGLDFLIKSYQENVHGLPTLLNQFCKCKVPPDTYRRKGVTNLLHKAVLSDNLTAVHQILAHKSCPYINAKNEWGSTALHDACHYGFEDIAEALIKYNADVQCLDKNGQTPLHRCCQNNKAGMISILVQVGKASLVERNPCSGWIALHQAAFKGYLECVKLLLDYHSPYLPRAEDETTPLDLAENYERKDCFNEIEKFEPPKIKTHRREWFHPELDRQGAQKLLELRGLREGMFLVRTSKRDPNWHVLTMCHDQKVFNYEIRTKHYRGRMMHYIDDGPYYRDVSHLIQYYCYHGNGLPCALTVSINTAKELVQILDDEDYSNIVNGGPRTIPMAPSPVLPPRPEEEYAGVQKRVSSMDLTPPKSPTNRTPPPPTTPPPPPNHPPPSILKQASIQAIVQQEVPLTRIDKHCLTIGKEIGQGEFGSVVKGVYKKQMGRKKEKIDVAIKLFHKSSINNQEDFLKEARTMQQLHHDYIVNFIGISESDNHELMLVEEFISMGSMLDYLIDYAEKIRKTDLYLWAGQIACGMMYLESQKMVHRDLAARNILLHSKHKAKISDFGLSRAVGAESDYYKATTGGKWPIKWYAPECVNFGQFSHASDVWSFGVTLWEMFSFGEPPYGEMRAVEVIKFIEEGKRLSKPDKCPDVAYKQMLKCWNKEAKERPTFEDLNSHFQRHEEYVSARDLLKNKK